ncbi:MAG: SIS domain-containing protein [Candidatus Firestonebacteria bacterium]
MKKEIEKELKESAKTILAARKISKEIEIVIDKIYGSYLRGGKLLVFGNGGSAADAQHFAAEFVGRFARERRHLPALALAANTSSVTAIGNDYGYKYVFSKQVEAFAREEDVCIGISTSGNSENIIEAMKKAKSLGCFVACLTGQKKAKMHNHADVSLKIPGKKTWHIQEAHIAILHLICKIVEERLFP